MSSSILTLPPELLNQILERSDYASGLALRYTCKTLYLATSMGAAVKQKKVAAQHGSASYNMSDLLQVEKWPCYDFAGNREDHLKQPLATRDFFACSLCLKIRRASKFSNAMMKGKRGKHSAADAVEKNERRKRVCIDCGVRNGIYGPGVAFEFGGARSSWTLDEAELGGGYGFVCLHCRQFRRVDILSRSYRGPCQACLETRRRA